MHACSKEAFSALLVLTLIVLGASPAAAAYPAGFSEVLVTGSIGNPRAMAFAPDGRIFVCRQNGELRIIKNGSLLATPFLTVSVNSSGERGLLGVAFHPDFENNNFVYVYYTTSSSPIHNRVTRFTANGDVVAAGSEQPIVELGQPFDGDEPQRWGDSFRVPTANCISRLATTPTLRTPSHS